MLPQPTQKDIAIRLNCGIKTVSYALADKPWIGERTKKQVLAIATEIGYRRPTDRDKSRPDPSDRICRNCGQEQVFSPNRRMWDCKPCRRKRYRELYASGYYKKTTMRARAAENRKKPRKWPADHRFRGRACKLYRGDGTRVTPWDLDAVWEKQEGKCALSGLSMEGKEFELDHIIPVAKGGTDDLENLRFVLKTANRAKGAMMDREFVDLCDSVVQHHNNLSSIPSWIL